MDLTKKDLFNSAEGCFITKFEYDSFENRKFIAKGGFAAVYSAYLKSAEKTVALKIFHDIKFYKGFVTELKNLNAVNHHKNIIKFMGISQEPVFNTPHENIQPKPDHDNAETDLYIHDSVSTMADSIGICLNF
ncbi:144_t:CDS:2 [Acaulospora morrowiae]|uniref:144_t:CDS:1 n=1 Tax=Acaulospora morrowiae TaxID=94023 RepID=A0A9N8VA14_9GLOM|nr:144_t:CDS:2 [Acaulospora morrowiae]